MTDETFRIDKLSVEGFKAFTVPQSFDFGGRNIFLFGPNGFGKTSIVEAIWWCLFGLASRQGEIVKNQFYVGNCIVQISLSGPDGIWTMQRRLRASGGESDLTVRDPSGTERNLEEVFPQLSHIGPREGAHVIYAAQQPSNRRQAANITDFRYVVYRYLGLEEIPRLADLLSDVSEDWALQETEICRRVEQLGDRFSVRISEIDSELNQITSDPLWSDTETPTTADTRAKVVQLIADAVEFGAACSKDEMEGLAPQDQIYEVETAIRAFFRDDQTDLDQRLQEQSSRYEDAKATLSDAETASNQAEQISVNVQALRQKLKSTLDGSTVDELECSLRETEGGFEAAQSRMDAIRASLKYLETVGDGVERISCPTCDTGFQPAQLVTLLHSLSSEVDAETEQLLERRDGLRDQILACKRLKQQIEERDTEIAKHREELNTKLEHGETVFGLSSPVTLESLRSHFEGVRDRYDEISQLSESKTQALMDWNKRTASLRREVRFHRLRSLKTRLQNLRDERYEDLHDSLRDLSDLWNIADETRTLLNTHLRERLQQDLPQWARR